MVLYTISMKIIVGLGNPGKKYEHTRHNAGFMAVDFFLRDKEAIKCESRFKGYVCEMHFTAEDFRGFPSVTEGNPLNPQKTFFVKPQTYMNNSGKTVKAIVDFYKIDITKDLLVVHDEVDLKFGYYKLAFDSRPAGHNGVKNIVEHLGTQAFHRIRIGVESRLSRFDSSTDAFVLQNFSDEELQMLENNVLPKVNKEIEEFITQ